MNSIDQARQDLQEKLDQGADPSALDELDTINTRRKRSAANRNEWFGDC